MSNHLLHTIRSGRLHQYALQEHSVTGPEMFGRWKPAQCILQPSAEQQVQSEQGCIAGLAASAVNPPHGKAACNVNCSQMKLRNALAALVVCQRENLPACKITPHGQASSPAWAQKPSPNQSCFWSLLQGAQVNIQVNAASFVFCRSRCWGLHLAIQHRFCRLGRIAVL